MRLVLLALGIGLGAWLVRKGRTASPRRVVVAWEDGSELELGRRAPGHDRLVGIAAQVVG